MNVNIQTKRLEDVAENYGITLEQAEQLRMAMIRTWEYISYDWFDCFPSVDDAYASHGSEAAMISEATLDANRIETCNRDQDLRWVYRKENGECRGDVLQLGEEIMNC